MAKTMSFATIHFAVAFGVGYVITGSIAMGGIIALIEPVCNTVAYYFHEKVWDKKLKRKTANRGALLTA